jgi:hypothetical protein
VFVALQEPVPTIELLLVSPRGGETAEMRTLAQLLTARARALSDR